MNAQCKFIVQSVTKFSGPQEQIKMTAITTGDVQVEEDKAFTKFTPYGELTFNVTNPAIVGKIFPGDKFLLDLTLLD